MIYLEAACLTLSLALPQGQESEGPMVGVPHAFSVSAGTVGGGAAMSDAVVWFKEPGFGGVPTAGYVAPSRPDFSIA